MPKSKVVKEPRKSKIDLEKENAELRAALKDKMALEHAQAEAEEVTSGPKMVPIKNFSSNYLVFEYQWRGLDKKLEMTSKGRRQMASVPLEIWYELERDTTLVSDGYIARVDRPIVNPNIIEDAAAVVNGMSEVDFADRVKKIVNPFSLFDLVAYLEPLPNKDGKQLMAQRAVRQRVQEVTGTQILDDV